MAQTESIEATEQAQPSDTTDDGTYTISRVQAPAADGVDETTLTASVVMPAAFSGITDSRGHPSFTTGPSRTAS